MAGQLNAAGLEAALDAAPQLPADVPLLEGQRLDAEAQVHLCRSDVFHAKHFERRQDVRAVRRVLLQLFGRRPGHLHHLIRLIVVVDAQRDDVVGEVLRAIGERANIAVGDGVDNAFDRAQHDGTQVDLFNRAFHAVDDRRVADPHLVLGNHEHAGDDVLDQRLGAKAHREAEDAGAGEDRGNVDVDLAQDDKNGRAPDQRREEAPERHPQRLGALAAFKPGGVAGEQDFAFGAPNH